ncbi:hypothetical protein ACFL6S_37030 [Candidatus Poribacteria bacterium]
MTLNTGDWTITTVEAGSGSASEALDDAVGGVLKITNDDADDDSDQFQKVGEAFKLASGKPLYFEMRFKVSDATQSDVLVGLCITDTTLIAGVSDGVYFRSDDGDANLDFVTEKNTTETAADTGVDLSDDTWIAVGFYFDGAGQVTPFVGTDPGDLTPYTAHTTNVPDDEELTPSFSIQNGEAAAKTMYVGYIRVIQKR